MLKVRILGYLNDFVKFKNKLKKSEEFKSFLGIIGEILIYGFLGGFTFLAFVSNNLFLRFFGIGCGLWLFQEKLKGALIDIFNSFNIVKIYR